MKEYLQESTNVVKSNEKFSKVIQILTYLLIWAVTVVVFWLGGSKDAMGYSLMSLYFVLPVTTFIISLFIGKDKSWPNSKWLLILFFGVMYMLTAYTTFSLANMQTTDQLLMPDLMTMIPGMITSLVGMIVGQLMKQRSVNKNSLSQ